MVHFPVSGIEVNPLLAAFVVSALTGSPEAVSLVDEIHIVAVAYVLIAAVMGVISWRDYDSGRQDRAAPRPGIAVRVRLILPAHQRDPGCAGRNLGLAALL